MMGLYEETGCFVDECETPCFLVILPMGRIDWDHALGKGFL